MSYCDVIFDDVTKTWYTNFLISNHQIYHLKEHDQVTIILKTVTRYDKYFSSYSNLKKLKNGVHYKQDNLLMNGSRSMKFSTCCPQAGCPGGKPRKTVFRGGFRVNVLTSFLILTILTE